MTVKIAKFLTPSSAVAAAPTPQPPPPPPLTSHYQHYHHKHQHHIHKNINNYPYHTATASDIDFGDDYVECDDDSSSMPYATATSIMTSRDHPFNNSSRPLLAERKPQLLLNKKKFTGNNSSSSSSSNNNNQSGIGNGLNSSHNPKTHYQQQQQRDSVKGLHGFNDFDIISQQYKHLNSHHIGYPYGSPPSPTANSNDFVFDSVMTTTKTNRIIKNSAPSNTAYSTSASPQTVVGYGATAVAQAPRHPFTSALATTPPLSTRNRNDINEDDDYYSFVGKSSRFEDDFCCRRNNEFAKIADGNGPFIFGLHHNQQQDFRRSPADDAGFLGNSTIPTVINDSNSMKYSMQNALTSTSNSDTSSSSRDSGKGFKFLVKNRKSTKKNPKDKKTNKGNQPTIKCVVVGDGAVGKTNLILSYLENRFIQEHVPTASDIYNADVMVNDNPVHVTLCDTAGQDTLDPLRELCYPDSDVFLLCFSVAKPETFHSIKTKWAPKFSKTKASLILVGTQSDLRNNANVLNKLQTNGEKPISFADAWDLATSIGAKYIETSSSTQEKVKDVFDMAIWEALAPTNLPPTPPLWKKLFCLV